MRVFYNQKPYIINVRRDKNYEIDKHNQRRTD